MSKFKTRTVYVDAIRFFPEKMPPMVNKRQMKIMSPEGEKPLRPAEYWVDTPQGRVKVEPGDWIITDAQGRYYVSKPENFARLYEPIEEKGNEKKNEKATKESGDDKKTKGSIE